MAEDLEVGHMQDSAVTASDVGQFLLDELGPMRKTKLLKLVFYAQAWSLAFGRSLFEEDIQAWAFGPVAPSVFHRCSAVPPGEAVLDIGRGGALTPEAQHLIRTSVINRYGQLASEELVALTHGEAPWLSARGNLPPDARSDSVISKQQMARFYRQQYESDVLGGITLEEAEAGHQSLLNEPTVSVEELLRGLSD